MDAFQPANNVPGRGGSAFCYTGSDDSSHYFFMAAGASRQEQYDDIYKIKVAKADDSVQAQKLNVVEMDGFSGRHSIGAANWNGKTFLFGGQDVM